MRNVYAYDAKGQLLTGVQLVDQDGRRLTVSRDQYDPASGEQILLTPWQNGRTELYSVFPLPERVTDGTVDLPEDARIPAPPFASLPPVTLTGVQPSVLLTPEQVVAQQKAAAARAERAEKAAQAKAKQEKRRFVNRGDR